MRFKRSNAFNGLAIAAAIAIAAVVSGCGEKVDPGQTASLTVTRTFGQTTVLGPKQTPVTAGLTAMRQLQGNAQVKTTYGGRFVNSIGNLTGSASTGNDWLFYVDGEQSDTGAASWRIKAGEVLQWDYHQWREISVSEATVGAYPRPFTNKGANLVCIPNDSAACTAAGKKFPNSGSKAGAVNVVVGTWDKINSEDGVPNLRAQAIDNGAFAMFVGKPGSLQLKLLDTTMGMPVTYGPGAGLVTAARDGKQITWIVTGTDEQGVEGAVSLLDKSKLQNKFSVAYVPSAGATPLPVPSGKTP